MGFSLFGFDFSKKFGLFGFWIFAFESFMSEERRSLFLLYYDTGSIRFEIFFIRVINEWCLPSNEHFRKTWLPEDKDIR